MGNYKIKGRNVTLYADPLAMEYFVEIAGKVWNMSEKPYVEFADGRRETFPEPILEERKRIGASVCVEAVYTGFHESEIKIRTVASVETITDDILFTVQVENDKRCEISHISFPAPFDFGTAYGDKADQTENYLPKSYTVLPRMQGILIPAGTRIQIADGRIFERDGYMPFYGQVRENTGYLAIYDTPYDVHYELRYADGGEKTAVLWDPSLGYMAYPRRMRYRFMENCDYNDFAKSYRAYVKEQGNLITLKEKFVKNPKAEKLPGCPVIHSEIAVHISPESDYYTPDKPEKNDYCTPFAVRAEQMKALHEKGLRKAYTHFDGWGKHGYDNLHPDPFPPNELAGGAEGMKLLADTTTGLGYIFGIHDQYRDYYYDAPTFSLENALMQADGGHPFCSVWYGGRHSFLCASVAREYVRRNYGIFKELGIGIEAAYLDVFSIVGLDECFNPAHPMTREECKKYRRECLDMVSDRGIIVSSEETIDCMIPSMILCHHAPYYTKDFGNLLSEMDGIPIPLFNLVYHDCIIIPWIGRKNTRGGWGIPKDASGYAFACLNANPAYLSLEADEEEIAEIMEVCAFAERHTHQQMIKHEFLSADRRIQKTSFSDGATVTVNFDTDEVIWKE